MSEFIAEAQVLVRPDTSKFRAELLAQLNALKIPPLTVPIVAAGAGLATAAAASTALSTAQKQAQATTLGLAQAAQIENTAFGRQAVILGTATAATDALAGAQATLGTAAKGSTPALLGAASASAKLDAALLGLRTAVGSTAVIGLGALALAAIAAGKAISASIKNFAAFQQEIATFRVTAGATAEQMRAISAEAQRLGDDVRLPAVSAADAAIAMTELAKAGLSVEDAMAGARGVLELATAAQISNAEAAQIAANALNAFGLEGDQASRVADDLANAANAAQGSISDFGAAFAQSSAVARQVGLSLEDTTALLSLFAKNGLQGSDAGTSLRVALIRLVAPTQQAAQEIQKLGLDIRDAQGNVRPDVFAQFGEATRNLAPSARDAAAALIFGQDAIRAVSIGAREGVDGLRLMQFQIDQTGTAAEVAGARTEGLAGSFSALQSTAQTLSIQLGKISSGPLKNLADGFSSVFAASTTALVGIQRLNAGLKEFIDSLPGGTETNSFIDFFASPGKAFAETAKILDRLVNGSDDASQKVRQLNDELQALQEARIQAEQGGQKGIADRLTKEIEALRDEIKAVKDEGEGIRTGVTAPLQEALTNLERVRDIRLSLNVDTGPIDRLIASLKAQIPITQQVEGNIQRLRDDVGDLGTKASGAAGGVDALTRALGALGRESARTQAELLKIQSEGAGPQQQIGLLQADITTQRQIIEEQKRRGGAPGSATAIKKAREQIIQDQNEIESLQAGIESDAKAAAASAKSSADRAQKARDEQFQALADLFGGRQQDIEDQIARAGIVGNVAKELRLNKALIASLKKELNALKDRLKTLKVSAAVRQSILQAINRAIEQAQQERLRLQQSRADAQQQAADARQSHLEAQLAIAETTSTKRDDIARQKALIAFDRAQIARIKAIAKSRKLTRDEKAQLDDYRVDLAQRNAALKELKDEADNTNKRFKELTFAFLQTQQGFAANLLGNLIPGFATAGLVGGSQAAPRPGDNLSLGIPAQGVAAGAAGSAALATSRDRGVRPVQVDTTNHLLRQILRSLQNLNGRAGHPEARYQKATGGAALDTL